MKKSLYKFVFVIALVFSTIVGFSQPLVPWDKISAIDEKIKIKGRQYPGKTIVLDGIIEPEKWYASDCRILFVLKEAWGGDNQDVIDIRAENRKAMVVPGDKGDGGETYRPMVTIANMLVYDLDYNAVSGSIYGGEAWSAFKGCSAIIEIKKIYGGTESIDNNIKDHASINAELLDEQVRVYNPNIVVIGVNNLLDGILIKDVVGGYEVFGEDEIVNYNDVEYIHIRGKEFKCYKTDNRIYINAFHPSYVSTFAQNYFKEYCEEIVRVAREWMEEQE